MRIALLLLLSLLMTASTQAQQQSVPGAVFEVVSIKPMEFPNAAYFDGFLAGAGGPCGFWQFTPVGNRVSLTAATACGLIRMAYDVKDYQVVSMPAWMTRREPSLFYQIEARAAEGTTLTVEQARPMLQALLADRFNLKFHREPRAAPVYALVVGKQGHKLSTEELPCAQTSPGTTYSMTGLSSCRPQITMSQLAFALGREVDRPVIDKTGLQGRYAFVLQWARTDPLSGAAAAPSVFTAVQEQLGLRLEAATDAVDAIVIDSIEPPTPN